jgi:hypothetical protein
MDTVSMIKSVTKNDVEQVSVEKRSTDGEQGTFMSKGCGTRPRRSK